MRRVFIFCFVVLLAIGGTGCVRDPKKETEGTIITIKGLQNDVVDENGTRIYHEGFETYWDNEGEAIGVFIDENVRNAHLQGVTENRNFATFSGGLGVTLDDGTYTAYAYYPYGNVAQSSDNVIPYSENARISIPMTQTPLANTFDPRAAILYSNPITITISGGQTADLQTTFNYATAIVNVVFADIAEQVDNEPITSFQITMPNAISGLRELNLKTGEWGSWYSGADKYDTIIADIAQSANVVPDGVNGIYLGLVPISLAAGDKVVIEAQTANYDITKTIIVPRDKAFEAGAITTLHIGATDMVIVPKSLEYDETLNNEWRLDDGDKIVVDQAGFDVDVSKNGIRFDFLDAMYNNVSVFMSYQAVGKEFNFEDGGDISWEVQYVSFYPTFAAYTGTSNSMGDVVEGKVIASMVKDQLIFNMSVLMGDGKILKICYDGMMADHSMVGIDMTEVDYDWSLTNQYKYDGQIYNIGWAGIKPLSTSSTPTYSFLMSTSVPVSEGVYTDLVEFQIPTLALGIENYRFLTNNAKINWLVDLFLNNTHIGGKRFAMGDVAGGKVYIDQVSNGFIIRAAVEFTDGKTLQVNYAGILVTN